VSNTSDLDDVLLIRNVKIDAEGKLDEASLRLATQLPISHEKLDTIEDAIEVTSLTPNLFTSSREILEIQTVQATATSQSANDLR
jgi:hypothetical protein